MKNQFSCIAISILAIAILFLCSRKRKEGIAEVLARLAELSEKYRGKP